VGASLLVVLVLLQKVPLKKTAASETMRHRATIFQTPLSLETGNTVLASMTSQRSDLHISMPSNHSDEILSR
jgi:hypothetical protein